MKSLIWLLMIGLLLILQGACGNPPSPNTPSPDRTTKTASQSTPTVGPTSQPKATTPPSETTTTPQTVAIAEAKFVPRSFAVEAADMAASDFDKDGHLDLVSAGDPQLTILRGDGEGGLTSFSRAPGGPNPTDFALADLDEDGDTDIVVANHDTGYLTILLGDGNGAFQPAPNSPFMVAVSPHPHTVRTVDLDSDGHVDLVVDHRDAEGVLVFRGLGDGGFDSPGTLVPVGGDPYLGMAFGDLDGDGKLDFVTPNPGEVGVLLNASDDQIAFIQASPVDAEAPFAVGLGDFDGDGVLDLIAASDEGSPLVEFFWGDGSGGFAADDDSTFRLAPGAKNIAVGDFNGDGIHDAAVASYHYTEVLVLLGGRDSIHAGYLPGDEHPWGLAAADMNEDGLDDLVIADDTSHGATLFLSLAP